MFFLGAVLLVLGYRRASEGRRRQIRWLLVPGLFAAAVAVIDVVAWRLYPAGALTALGETALTALWILAVASLPLSVAVALLRPGALDVDRVIRRSLVYGFLMAKGRTNAAPTAGHVTTEPIDRRPRHHRADRQPAIAPPRGSGWRPAPGREPGRRKPGGEVTVGRRRPGRSTRALTASSGARSAKMIVPEQAGDVVAGVEVPEKVVRRPQQRRIVEAGQLVRTEHVLVGQASQRAGHLLDMATPAEGGDPK